MANLDDIEKRLISSDDLELEDLLALAERISIFCSFSTEGYPKVSEKRKMSDRQRIHLVLAGLYLANKIQTRQGRENKISPLVNADKLLDMLRIKRKTGMNRLRELGNAHSIKEVAKGEWTIIPSSIESLLKELEL